MARIAVKSDIAGTVWKIETQTGQRVSVGDALLVIESMKMEIPVLAGAAGTVAELLVHEQEPVQEGQPLLWLDT